MKTVIAILVVSVASISRADNQAAEYTYIDGTDCNGHDISNFEDTTLQNCMAQCSFRHDCKSFQFNVNDHCYLKNYACSAGEMTDNPTAKMYNKDYYLIDGTDCNGHDINNFPSTTVENCAAQCNSRGDCKSFQFNVLSHCYLKNYACTEEEMIPNATANSYNKVDA